jgi:GT2 family glycosyltransferase
MTDSSTRDSIAADVVILDIDGGDMLHACLRSLAAQTLVRRRVLVFDNGSATPVAARLPELPLHIDVLRSETNLGFTGGINAAMASVDAELVALINNDVVLDPEWLAAMTEAMSDPSVAAVQSVIRTPDGRIDGAGIDLSDGTIRQRGYGLPLAEIPTLPAAWGVSATAALYRVEALRAVAVDGHVLRPEFFAYYEDVELNARLLEAGYRTVVVPRPLATHTGSASASLLGSRAARLRMKNRYRVHRLHPGVGRLGALVWEDVKRVVRGIAGGEPRSGDI